MYKCLFLKKKSQLEHKAGNLEYCRPKVINMKSLCNFSCLWDIGNIIMITKSKKPPTLPGSYCLISLLSVILKIFEQFLLACIQLLVDDIICEEQFRFQWGTWYSSENHYPTDYSLANEQMPPSGISTCCPVGCEQTIDIVQLEILLYKLAHTQIPTFIAHLKWSHLFDWVIRVSIDRAYSRLSPITAGFPHESALGTVYTNDLPVYPGVMLSLFVHKPMFH